MLIIEIHVDTIENAEASPSTRQKREAERPKRASDHSQIAGSRLWKAIKHRAPGYLIQFHKNEK